MSTIESAPRTPVVYRPESAVFWLYVCAVATGTGILLYQKGGGLRETLSSQAAFAPLWLVFIAVMVWLMFRFDPYRSVRPFTQGLVAGVVLGGTVATSLATLAIDPFEAILMRFVEPETWAAWEHALRAPIIEEASKAMCAAVILVLCRAVFTRLSHALLVGMFVGFGFDIVEDLIYVIVDAIESLDSDTGGIFETLVGRFEGGIPGHWAYTGLTAVGVLLLLPSFDGRDRWSPPARVGTAAALMSGGFLLHFWNNSPMPDNTFLAVVSLLQAPIALAVVVAVAVVVQRTERDWVIARIAATRDTVLADVEPAVLDALPSLRARRRLRRQAKREGGRTAKNAMKIRQRRTLDRIQKPEPCTSWPGVSAINPR